MVLLFCFQGLRPKIKPSQCHPISVTVCYSGHMDLISFNNYWLVVSTHLKNISQLG